MANPHRGYHSGLIGVHARPEDHPVVREFFELFKTSWEFCRPERRYDVVLQADGRAAAMTAPLVVVYDSQSTPLDAAHRCRLGRVRSDVVASCHGERLPVYGPSAPVWTDGGLADVVFEDTEEPLVAVIRTPGTTIVRAGFDLFSEIRALLSTGQPPANAAIPTLERHISLLRRWILGAGIPVVELPPVPARYPFMVCLTHDVDHPSIRLHRFDHTMLGFLHRALVGSLVNVCRRRTSMSTLRQNAAAALALPFVHLGWANDFWLDFDRYLEIEKGLGSTFFFIPAKDTAGRTAAGRAPRMRASAYDVADVAGRARGLATAGCDVGVHGIDAWLDSTSARHERDRVSRVTGVPAAGVRMHWLYFDEGAPARLEEAGFTYDSTFGYNETVGFRAGTLQAYRPISARRLLELPLHVMDTALFFPSHLDLTSEDAHRVVAPLVDAAGHHGGALTINWHDRSLAPERLWGGFYLDLLDELKRRNPWFPTASQAVSWFHRRRSARIRSVSRDGNALRVAATADPAEQQPALTLRVHRPCAPNGPWPTSVGSATNFTDVPFSEIVDARVEV